MRYLPEIKGDESMSAYLLLDAALIEDLGTRLVRMESFITCHPLYINTAYEALADCGPMLVAVASESALEQLFIKEWQTECGIWLETEADEAELIGHLRSLVHVRLDEDVTVLFRYYDPRITRLWLTDTNTAERDKLMGPVQRIRLITQDGSPYLIDRQTANQPSARYTNIPWLKLGTRQLEALSQAQHEQFDQHLIEHCTRYFPDALQELDAHGKLQWASACRKSAGRHGFTADNEVTRWVSLYASLGGNFPEGIRHGTYRRILEDRSVPAARRLDALVTELGSELIKSRESDA